MCQSSLLQLFCELVRIESPSYHEGAMAKRCAEELHLLGFSVNFDQSASKTGSDTGNIIAQLPGTCPGHVMFSAHLDTVKPCHNIEPVIKNEVICSAGPTILSADDKAGIAAIFEGVRRVLESGVLHPHITIILTTCEEVHLVGVQSLASDMLSKKAPCYVLDAQGSPGSIITGAPCHYSFKAQFKGRSAHAGVEPEAGVSAINMAAHAISALNLGRIDKATTANLGTIEGGSATNVVADLCTLEGECRSLYTPRAEEQMACMTKAFKRSALQFGGDVEVAWSLSYGPVLYDEDDPLVQGIIRAARRANLQPNCMHTGGGSDANILVSQGVRAITLGIGMMNFHSLDEYIRVSDLEDTARLVEALVQENAQG